jgi:ADP-heptose:LPS heptosyltransferase
VLVHQGPADAEAAAGLRARLGEAAILLREPELPRLAGVLAAARAYLGGDSGVSHLAAAVGAPSVVLFPPATRRRWAPWSPTAVSLELTGAADDVERVIGALARALGADRAPQ